MKRTSACQTLSASLGAVALLAIVGPALAGDLSNGAPGGIRDYGSGGVPVPVPAPYEETFKWYTRADVGTGFKHSGRFAIEGLPAEVTQPADWHEHSILSFGFGRYITPSFRTEFTLDYRTPRNIASGARSLADITKSARLADTSASVGGVTVPVINTQTNMYSGVQDENTNYQNSTFLMSAFYDFNREGRLKPYVGAGVGLARHELHRGGAITYTCFDGFQTSTPVGGSASTIATGCTSVAATGTPPAGGLNLQYVSPTNKTATGWGVAAQVSAGLTYDLTPRTHWDTGYRMLWQSGRVGVASADGLSTIRVQDRTDHEVRTGIRWDVW
jgi:opacity protein-like surface antigen